MTIDQSVNSPCPRIIKYRHHDRFLKGSIEEIGLLYSVWQMIDTLNVLVPLGYFRVVNYRH